MGKPKAKRIPTTPRKYAGVIGQIMNDTGKLMALLQPVRPEEIARAKSDAAQIMGVTRQDMDARETKHLSLVAIFCYQIVLEGYRRGLIEADARLRAVQKAGLPVSFPGDQPTPKPETEKE